MRYRSVLPTAFAFVAIVLLACGKTAARGDTAARASSAHDAGVAPPTAPTKAAASDRTIRMIRLILDDLEKGGRVVGGGGVSEIKAMSSTSYRVSLPKEERVEMITYTFALGDDGSISIRDRKDSVQSF